MTVLTDEEIYEGQKVCCTCAYFVQHYRKYIRALDGKESYSPVGCGHCLKRRPKRYPPETPGCERWKQKS